MYACLTNNRRTKNSLDSLNIQSDVLVAIFAYRNSLRLSYRLKRNMH